MKTTVIKNLKELSSEYSVLAVAGKMASGKNFICSQLESYGWHSIDADLLVHKAIEQSSAKIYETFKEYESQFNIKILNSDGTINRRNLGVILFSNSQLMKKQEEIVYPVITQMVKDFIEKNPKSIINATVLYKTPDLLQLCDALLFVKSNCIKRFFRTIKRDHLPVKQILKRFYSQKNLLKKYKTAQTANLKILIVKN